MDMSLSPLSFSSTSQTNAAQLNNQLAGVYSALTSGNLYGYGLWGYFEGGNDEWFATNDYTGSQTDQLTESFRSSSQDASYSALWKSLYGGIESANVLLSVINQPVMDSATRANIKGQALFLRAYYYYLLVSNFGDVPYKTQLTSNTTNFNIPATPSAAIYDSIINDMTSADSLVKSMAAVQTTTVVTKSAVEGVLARVCLGAAGYPIHVPGSPSALHYDSLALNWAEKVINTGYHSLYSSPQQLFSNTPAYARVFINNMQDNYFDNNIQEDMWDASFLSNGMGTYASTGYTATQQLGALNGILCPGVSHSNGQYRIFPSFYNLYGAGDLRRDWNVSNYVLDSNNTRLSSMGAIIKINPGYSKTPIDTIYNNGIPTIQYDTTYYGSGATAIDSINLATGGIVSITVTNGGSGYNIAYPPSISVSFPAPYSSSGGKPITYRISWKAITDSTYSIKSITVTNPSSNYYITLYDRTVAKWRREYEINTTKNGGYTSCEFPIIRYADVLLMAAEADLMVRGGGSNATSKGISYYNQVKRRAYGYSPTSSSPVDVSVVTLDSIKAERSRELCFEGLRKNDLKRWGLTYWTQQLNSVNNQMGNYNQTLSALNSIMLQAAPATITNFLSNPTKYSLFPIPASEIALESALYQNPGW